MSALPPVLAAGWLTVANASARCRTGARPPLTTAQQVLLVAVSVGFCVVIAWALVPICRALAVTRSIRRREQLRARAAAPAPKPADEPQPGRSRYSAGPWRYLAVLVPVLALIAGVCLWGGPQ